MLDPTKKRYPMSKGKGKPHQGVRRSKIVFKPQTCWRHSEGSNKTLCALGPRRKEQWPHKRLPTLACECVLESPPKAWVGGAEIGHVYMGPFEGGLHYLYYFHHSLLSGQAKGKGHSTDHQEKNGLKIYKALSCTLEQDPISPTDNLSHQETFISHLFLSIRGQTEWKPQSQKTNQTRYLGHNFV